MDEWEMETQKKIDDEYLEAEVLGSNEVKGDLQEEEPWEDPFTALMFGSSRTNRPIGVSNFKPAQESSTSNQPPIDFEEMMIHVETLMDSVNSLKPLFQKALPYIQQFWKKK